MTKYYACTLKTKRDEWQMALHLHKSKKHAKDTARRLQDCVNVKKAKVVKVKV